MKAYGQFDVPNTRSAEYEFPCPKCGETIDVLVLHDAGTGTVNVPALGENRQKSIKAQGLP